MLRIGTTPTYGFVGRIVCLRISPAALLALLFGFSCAPAALSDTCTTTTTGGNWNTAGNWSCNHVPLAADDVVVNRNFTVNTTTAAVQSVTITAGTLTQSSTLNTAALPGGALNISGGTFNSTGNMTIGGATTISAGTFNPTGNNTRIFTGLVTISGGSWIGTSRAATFRNGITFSSGTFTAGSGMHTFNTNNQEINGTLAISNVTVTGVTLTNNNTFTVGTALSGTGGLTNAGTGTLNIGGTSGIGTLTANASGNTVNYTGAAQAVKATTYHHLGLSGSGAKTFTSATVNGNLALSGSATATLTGLSTITGNVTTSGTATATTAANLSIGGNLTVGTGTTFTSANVTNSVEGTTSVTGTLAHSGVAAKTYIGPVTINSGGTWTNAGNAPVNFQGGLTHSGTTFTSGSGVYTFGTNNQAISGTLAISNVTVTGVTLTNNNTLTVGTALSGTGGLTNAGTGTLNIGGTSAISALTANASGNTVNYTGGAQTINATTYHHLGLSGSGAKTFTSATVNGNLALSGSATATLTGVSTITGNVTTSGTATATTAANLSIGGNLTVGTGTTFTSANVTNSVAGTTSVTGTLAHSGVAAKTYIGPVTINSGGTWTNAGNAPVNFQGGVTHSGTTFTSGSGVYTFDTNNQAISGTLAISNVTVTGVTLTNNNTLTVGTALSGTGGLTNAGTGTLNIGGTSAISALTANASGNTVSYSGAGQTIKATSYYTLNVTGTATNSGTVTVASALGGSGALTNSATGTLNIGGTSAITTLTASAGGNIVNYTGAAQTIKAASYDTLNVTGTATNSGTVTVAAALGGSGALTNSATGTLNIGGTSTITTLTATAVGNTVNYTGTGQTVIATVYSNLNVSGTATNNGTVTVATSLGGSGALANTGTLNIGGTSGITTLTANATDNTVNYTGAAQSIKATTYYHIGLSGSGAKTFTSATIGGNLSLSGSATATLTGVTVITGNVSISGTATATTAANLSIGGNLTVGTGTTFTSANFTNLVSGATSITGTLAHSGVAAKTYTGAVTINAGGAWTNAGNAPVTFSGDFTKNATGSFTSGSGIYTFNGSSAQSITGSPTFQNLAINSSGGVTLVTGSVTVSVVLTLTNGIVTTGANTLVASGANCTTSVNRTSGYVIGNLQITFPNTNPVTCNYPVGDSIGYAPISITKSGTNTGTLIGRADSGDHPDGSATGIVQTKNANHYWTLTVGASSPLSVSTPYTANFQFCATATCVVPTEVDSGATISNFSVAKKSGTWTNQTVNTPTFTSIQATGLTGFGVFEVGEPGNVSCISLTSGNWNTASTWTNCHGNVPLAGDIVTIDSSHSVTLNTTTPAISNLTINGTLTASAANTLTLGGNLTNNGTLSLGTFGSVTLTADTQWTGTGTTWTLNNLTLGSHALDFNATDTFTLGIKGSVSGLGTINSGATNTGITIDFSGTGAQAVPTTGVIYPNLSVSGGSTKTPASGTLDISGDFSVGSGTSFAGSSNNPTVMLKGNFSNSGTFDAGAGLWTLSGISAQSITGTPSFGSLTFNNASGVNLSSDVTVSTALALNGTVTTGANTLVYSNANCATSPITRTSGYVVGNLKLTFPAGTPTCTYPVGDSIGYSPVTVTIAVTGAGTLVGRVDESDHPDTDSSASGIDATKSANHYWTLTAGTLTSSSYSAIFQFCANSGSCTASEVDLGANTGSFIVALKSSGIWTSQTAGTRNAYSTQATGMTGFGVFAVGELSTNNCYNDGFTGTDGSSPGTNWSVGYKTGTFGNPAIFGNRLRLTNASGTVATWATLQRLFPASGNKVTIEFNHFAYGGTGSADGLAVVLSDASVAPVAGAFGGSLGYAQKSNPGSDCTTTGGCPGFAGGWLGIALDEFGNYSTNTEGRFGGVTTRVLNSVAVRGSGSGMSGYRFLQGTSTLSPVIDGNNAANPPHRYRIVVDHTDGVHAWTSVERDTTAGGSAYTTLIGCPPGVTSGCTAFDVKEPGYSQNAVPSYWNLSFTGSTGGSTNIHEIDSLKVCTVQGLASPVLHHIKIEHGGTACTSNAATVTVKACADAACDALYVGSVTVNMSTTGGTWSSASPITFSGGQTTLTLTDTTSRSDTLGATATSPTASNVTQCFNGTTQTCALTFAACTFDVIEAGAAVNTPIYTKLANTAFNLDVLSRSGSSQTLTAIELVDMSSGTCASPAGVLSPVTLSPSLATSGIPNFTANQRKTFSFIYNNAAPNVRVRVTTAGPLYSCSSDNFAIRPQTFTLTSNATQTGSSGTPIFRAGADPFTLSATAVYSTTTTNSYAGTPKLNLTSGMITTTLAHLGTLGSTTFSAAISGIATASNLTYSEVGNFSLAQYAVYDDTFADVDSVKGECTSAFSNTLTNSRYSCQFGSDAAGAFGRFVPDHFTVVGTVANACPAGTFTYMGQPFTLSSTNVVEARNAGNGVTQNYAGSYAPGTVSFGAENADNGTDLSLRLTFSNGNWVSGLYTLASASGTFSRPVTAVSDATWGSFESLDVGLTVVANEGDLTKSPDVSGTDMDPVTVGGSIFTHKKFSGSPIRMRLGRISLENAYGSELLDLPMSMTAEYWNGNGWVNNTDDQCTTGITLAAADPIAADGLVPAELFVWDTGIGAGNSGMGYSVAGTNANTFNEPPLVTNGGNFNLNFRAPGADNTGALDITATVPNYLKFNWKGAGDTDPAGRATFGIYKGNSRFIYIRELY